MITARFPSFSDCRGNGIFLVCLVSSFYSAEMAIGVGSTCVWGSNNASFIGHFRVLDLYHSF